MRKQFFCSLICLGALLLQPSIAHADIKKETFVEPQQVAQQSIPDCCEPKPIRKKNFSLPTIIDNKWLPIIPGNQYTLKGTSNQGGTPHVHFVTFTVTDLVKEIEGFETVVVIDIDSEEGGLILERELAFFAQDNKKNVWSLGEYPEEFEDGKFVGAPNTWISGVEGAHGGILVQGKPKLDTPCYLEGSSPDIDFLDCGRVLRKGRKVCVPTGCYKNVLVIEEFGPLEPDSGFQHKFYAAGVGVIKITAVDDPEGETLELIEQKHLNPCQMKKINQLALKLDRRAYKNSEVYRHTEPAHFRCGP